MLDKVNTQYYWQHLSLAARISALLVLAAILPLVVAVGVSELLLRPALINQVSKGMETDAQTRTQLIDAYMAERLLETETISRLPPIQQFLAHAPPSTAEEQAARESLTTGHVQGSHYENWSLFDLQGNLRLYYPTAPQLHGAHYIQPAALPQLQIQRRTLVSDVFYNPITNDAYIDLYAPVTTPSYKVVGILRTTFDLSYIWQIVDDDARANGLGSYAFILDQNGVCIAATNFYTDPASMTLPTQVFTAIAPLQPQFQHRIRDEGLYGISGTQMLPVHSDPNLVAQWPPKKLPLTFELTPVGQQETFQVASWKTYRVPWTYYVLSPLKTVTAVADQQLQIITSCAALVLVLAITFGVVVGRRFAQPIARSIEEQRLAYQHQQRLNQLKDQFLINVSHELRTPLTEVYGYLHLLSENQNRLDSTLQTTFLRHAMNGCEDLKLLVSNVLDTVDLDSQMKQPCNMQNVSVLQMVKGVIEQFEPRTVQNYQVQVQIDETFTVQADAQLMRQVLRNLLSNAFKYTPQQTAIVVSAQAGEDVPSANAAASQVAICVRDHGPGIAPDDIPLLFGKFVRLKQHLSGSVRGTGLGLYISKRLVETMGGRIWVESTGIPGEGSSFYFTLPVAANNGHTDQE